MLCRGALGPSHHSTTSACTLTRTAGKRKSNFGNCTNSISIDFVFADICTMVRVGDHPRTGSSLCTDNGRYKCSKGEVSTCDCGRTQHSSDRQRHSRRPRPRCRHPEDRHRLLLCTLPGEPCACCCRARRVPRRSAAAARVGTTRGRSCGADSNGPKRTQEILPADHIRCGPSRRAPTRSSRTVSSKATAPPRCANVAFVPFCGHCLSRVQRAC